MNSDQSNARQNDDWLDAVLRLRSPLEPIATKIEPKLGSIPNIRAVIFDIYGTLIVSGTGDVGSADATDRGTHLAEAFEAAQIQPATPPSINVLHDQIRDSNDARKSEACPKPEVDIADIWRKSLRQWSPDQPAPTTESVIRLAAEYEARSNPTWPMPGATDLINTLNQHDLQCGIVSNAQIFTVRLLEDLVGGPLDTAFHSDLCIFSNRYRQAKPGPRLFDALVHGLKRSKIEPEQSIYVGNDMLNDVWAASVAGLKTAWFAGDQRSCRPRSDDDRCKNLEPDLVLTDLMQLLGCLEIK